MKHFLLVYARRSGSIVRFEEFPQADDALTARFDAEDEFDGDADIEVVALSSPSEEYLRKTHARYFRSVGELIGDTVATLEKHEAAARAV